MQPSVTAQSLFEQHQRQLELVWLAGKAGGQRQVNESASDQHTSLVGHLNLINPCTIQVLGNTEVEYLASLGKNSLQDTIYTIFNSQPLMVILAEDQEMNGSFLQAADTSQIPLFSSPLSTNRIIDHLHYTLHGQLSEKFTQHGVFMEVMGLGLLLTGPSGIGKSELALELLSRGHRLIADDAPEFQRTAPEVIHGRCPPLLADFLEVRGLGIINVRAMYGNHAVLQSKRLHLIIQIQPPEEKNSADERLDVNKRFRRILEVDIPEVILAAAPGRDLSVIIEAAVRNHILFLNGYNASQDFIERQQQHIKNQGS